MYKKTMFKFIATVLITAILTASVSIIYVFPRLESSPTDDGSLEDENKIEASKSEDNDYLKISEEDYNYLMGLYKKYEELEVLQEFINDNYYLDVSDIDFMSEMAKGLFKALEDPYSQYFTPEEYKMMLEDANGSYEGIGVVVAPGEDGFITVVSPISTSPGFEAGLKPGDKILEVDGIEYFADELEKAVMNIRGPKDTTVTLTIQRDGEFIDIPVVRREIIMDSVQSKLLEDKIAYIQIASFDENVSEEFMKHYNALEPDSLEGLIIDLRFNGGGYLHECIALTDFLIDEGVIVKTKDRDGTEDIEYAGPKVIDEFLVILTNGGSASASEILTGAVKDNDEGVIIGTTTFGKGLVQTMRPLLQFDQAGFKLTIQQYFTPNDNYIHGVGIDPDIVIEDDPETEIDEVIEKALEVIKENMN
jgi:carboxyl-terminal processing protease